MIVNYERLFFQIEDHLLTKMPASTSDITKCVKDFFRAQYGESHNVLCSHLKGSEFLLDVMVTTFNPKNIVERRTLEPTCKEHIVFLAVESELGGVGASSAYGVMKNVAEDFLKLLVTRCAYRVMIFTSLPYDNEENHISNRVETLRKMYFQTLGLDGGVLLVHLEGAQPKSSQVQAQIGAGKIRGFQISADGNSVVEIKLAHP